MSLPLIDVYYPISTCVSAYVYMDTVVQVQMHVCTRLCEGQKLMSCVFLLHSLTVWIQDLLMNLELTYPARLSSQQAPVILLSPVHCWNYRLCLLYHVSARDQTQIPIFGWQALY